MRPALWTPPNLITLSRLFLAPVLLVLAYAGESTAFLALFCASLVTDIVDGKLARWLGQASEFGARLDSWADFATYTTVPVCAYWLKPEIVLIPASDGAKVPARIYRPRDMGAKPNGAGVIFVHGAGYMHNVHN